MTPMLLLAMLFQSEPTEIQRRAWIEIRKKEAYAELQADNEVAESVGGIATAGMSEEEQALFEELEREAKGGVSLPDHADESAATEPLKKVAEAKPTQTAQTTTPAKESTPPTKQTEPRRNEPEPG